MWSGNLIDVVQPQGIPKPQKSTKPWEGCTKSKSYKKCKKEHPGTQSGSILGTFWSPLTYFACTKYLCGFIKKCNWRGFVCGVEFQWILCTPGLPNHNNHVNHSRVAQNQSSLSIEKGSLRGRTLAPFFGFFCSPFTIFRAQNTWVI